MDQRKKLFIKRRQRVRNKLRRSATGRPRLSIHRTGQHIYAQVIDDVAGRTLASASSLDEELKSGLETGLETHKQGNTFVRERCKTVLLPRCWFTVAVWLYSYAGLCFPL